MTPAWRPPTSPPPPPPSPTLSSARLTSSEWTHLNPPHPPHLRAEWARPMTWPPASPAVATFPPYRRTTSWRPRRLHHRPLLLPPSWTPPCPPCRTAGQMNCHWTSTMPWRRWWRGWSRWRCSRSQTSGWACQWSSWSRPPNTLLTWCWTCLKAPTPRPPRTRVSRTAPPQLLRPSPSPTRARWRRQGDPWFPPPSRQYRRS